MTAVLKIGQQTLDAPQLIERLKQYRLLPQLVQEFVIDTAIAHIEGEPSKAMESYCAQRGLFSDEQRQAWCQQQGLSPQEMLAAAMREYKLMLFKEETWGAQIESYFLQRKTQLDRVCYSLIRTKNASLAQEIYFRLNDDGVSFNDLARQYSEGQESKTGGFIGPVELNVPHPVLARMLSVSQPGQLWAPTQIGEWLVIARLEQFEPAQFTDTMRQRLLTEQFQTWLRQQLQETSVSELQPMSAPPDALLSGESVAAVQVSPVLNSSA
ncbi:MAG: peptidylprolyl isomerase [Cyanobacteria bacterium P01_D01_bin.36]